MDAESSQLPEDAVGEDLTDAIKLIVWDLDGTYWRGTLSEGGIEYDARNHSLLVEAARRGIVSSICSKNDLEAVRAKLIEHGAWEYFVFPHVAWGPKGQAIAAIIDAMQLRSVNVLFIDDNPMNLHEARHYAPGLQVATPDILDRLLSLDAMKGKPDPSLSRLEHYKLLERRAEDREQLDISNVGFLRQSDVRVRVGRDVVAQAERLYELVMRTNQLNFTKERPSRAEFDELLSDPAVDAGYVQVIDKYGDYGISGFFALRKGRLEHFLFSCRTMSMGVEQWLYAKLGRPELVIQPPVSALLDDPSEVDWITEHDVIRASSSAATSSQEVFFKGGCDLQQTLQFLDTARTVTEINTVLDNGHAQHVEHTEVLRRCTPETLERYGALLDRIPFLSRAGFETRMFEPGHGVVIYSALMDYTQGLYRYEGSDFVLPYGDFLVDATSSEGRRMLEGIREYPPGFFDWFSEVFAFEGGLSPERFAENLRWIRRRIPDGTALIVINGAEVPVDHPYERGRHLHHRLMNGVVDEVIAELPSSRVCDVRKHVKSRTDLGDNIRHYQRRCYHAIAEELRELVTVESNLALERASASRLLLDRGMATARGLLARVRRKG